MSQRPCATTTTPVVLPWATRFFEELTKRVAQAHAQPQRFHPVAGELRRANLERFPYHFLFRVRDDTVRVLVVRHLRRRSAFVLLRH